MKTAVPTIFNFPPRLTKRATTRPTRTKLVGMTGEVSDNLGCTSVPSCSSSSNTPGPGAPSCSVLDVQGSCSVLDEAVTDFDNGDSGSIADHNNAIVEENYKM